MDQSAANQGQLCVARHSIRQPASETFLCVRGLIESETQVAVGAGPLSAFRLGRCQRCSGPAKAPARSGSTAVSTTARGTD